MTSLDLLGPYFFSSKDDTFDAFVKFAKVIQNQLSLKIISLRSDHGGEFVNLCFEDYCDEFGISHNFSCPRTPQQNGVVERKNRVLDELARTMINKMNLPKYLWVDTINIACHVLNRIVIRPILDKAPYYLLRRRKPNLSYLRVFGCKCFILNKDKLSKFDAKADDVIFLGYYYNNKAYRVFNKRTLVVEETIHVAFDETPPQAVGKCTFGFDVAGIDTKEIVRDGHQQEVPPKNEDNKDKEFEGYVQEDEKQETSPFSLHDWITMRDHLLENILGDIRKGVSTRSQVSNFCGFTAFVSQIEPKTIKEAIIDECWTISMQDVKVRKTHEGGGLNFDSFFFFLN